VTKPDGSQRLCDIFHHLHIRYATLTEKSNGPLPFEGLGIHGIGPVAEEADAVGAFPNSEAGDLTGCRVESMDICQLDVAAARALAQRVEDQFFLASLYSADHPVLIGSLLS
jgi:hypothetical protein